MTLFDVAFMIDTASEVQTSTTLKQELMDSHIKQEFKAEKYLNQKIMPVDLMLKCGVLL